MARLQIVKLLSLVLFLELILYCPIAISTEVSDKIEDFSSKQKKLLINASFEFWSKTRKNEVEIAGSLGQIKSKINSESMTLAPCSSDLLEEYFSDIAVLRRRKSSFYLNCVTASPEFDKKFPTVSVFPRSRDYLRTVFKRLLVTESGPKRVVVLFDFTLKYLLEARAELNRLISSEMGEGPLIQWVSLDELKRRSELGQDVFSVNDWIVIWTPIRQKMKNMEKMKHFMSALKIIPYGPSDPTAIWPHTARVMFWHPNVSYEKSNQNCAFSADFRRSTKLDPDFHSAYLFSTLEVGLQVLNSDWRPLTPNNSPEFDTLFGRFRLDHEGRILNYIPVILLKSGQKQIRLDLGDPNRKMCGT
ncbi:MAG: hypothetical protein IPL83_06600 [Bdellovibrionales bacterium]|nr:hypothetical protein [Bdellovibrionales bacterium]